MSNYRKVKGIIMWNTIESAPSGRLVMTKIDDANGARNEQPLSRNGNLWFSGEMYVYYRPTHWRELTEIEKLRIKNDAERKGLVAETAPTVFLR